VRRAFLVVLDSVGIGGAPDAAAFGDEGANTLGHIAEACAQGRANRAVVRSGALEVPNLCRLGLSLAAAEAIGRMPGGLLAPRTVTGQWGVAVETSRGKDTVSGHWEIAGVPVDFDWGYFPSTVPCLPAALRDALIREGRLPGILGDKHASGTAIIAALGLEHMRTGKPIVYTSADSVLQIAAHEHTFGLERLLDLCRLARKLVDDLNIGRVIARPFIGSDPSNFERTGNRRDFAMPPPGKTLLDRLTAAGREVRSIGKIGDIFAGRSTGTITKASGHDALFDRLLEAARELAPGGLAFVNFVDFDTLYGHRRDVAGYAAALEHFDRRLPKLLARLRPGDFLVLTADHGCDPTWKGSDHTRECVPVLAWGPDLNPGPIGRRPTFADIGQTVASSLEVSPLAHGTTWITPNTLTRV
jgi:phosphopentomutase